MPAPRRSRAAATASRRLSRAPAANTSSNRSAQGLDPDPMAAYARSGYDQRIVAERVGGTQAGWGA